MKKRNMLLLALFLVAIVLVLILPSTVKKSGPGPVGVPNGLNISGITNSSLFSVRTTAITRGTLQDYIKANGDVAVISSVKVYPQVAGEIQSVKVALGSKVSKGQIIAEIDPSMPGSAYAINSVYAPIAGTIISSPLPIGSTITTSSVIVEIGNIDDIELLTMIPERYVGVLKTGLKATVSFKAYPGESFSATVTQVSPILDAGSRTKTIRLTFDKADPRINVGMFGTIRLNTVRYVDCLTVPESALLSNSSGSYIFIVNKDSTVSMRTVTLGVSVDGIVELTSGVTEGELVVIEGSSVLVDGAMIRDISTNSAIETGVLN